MPLTATKIEVLHEDIYSPGGYREGTFLGSDYCVACLDGINWLHRESIDKEVVGSASYVRLRLPVHIAAVLSVRKEGSFRPPYNLCRSHGAMFLGEPKVTEILGEKP
jgi:hypothetical protein